MSGVGSSSKRRSSGPQSMMCTSGANVLSSFDDARAAGVRRTCERYAVHLGLHTASAVNVAEVAPYVADAVEHHRFAPVTRLEWRSIELDFSSPDSLVTSLRARPRSKWLRLAGDAEDAAQMRRRHSDITIEDARAFDALL